MPSPVEDIKTRLDLVELIQSYIRLEKAGVNFKACCPFHSEKTPSFVVSPARQIWHCFGCNLGGDHFKFVMQIEGLEFREALELLARRAGVMLRAEDPAKRSERARLLQILEEAAKMYEAVLHLSPRAELRVSPALAYLKKRGLTDETIKAWRMGFAPDSWDFLIRALEKKGYRSEEVAKAGLAVKSEQGSFYDRFRNRIMFPISDAAGRVVGFSGRIFDEIAGNDEIVGDDKFIKRSDPSLTVTSPIPAKYINTPQTVVYDKSRVLYGFDKAKENIRRENCAVLVEGQMDAVMSHQAGVKNAVAVSGTALTADQLKTLRRLCDTLINSFDRDLAGERASKRSLDLAAVFGFDRKAALLPQGIKDPAELAAQDPALWQKAVAEAKAIAGFYLETALVRHDPKTPQGKKAIASEVLGEIKLLSSEVEKAHWVQELSRAIGVSEEALWRELSRIKPSELGAAIEAEHQTARAAQTRREQLEALLLGTLILYPDEAARLKPLPRHFFSHQGHLRFLELLETCLGGELRKQEDLMSVLPQDLKEQASYLAFQAEVVLERIENFQERTREIQVCLQSLEREWARERLGRLSEELRQAEAVRDEAKVRSLLQEFQNLSALAK